MNHISENNASDRQLVTSVLSGNNHAFAVIIKNTEALVAQIVYKLVENAEDRRDLAQDVYLKVYASLGNFKFQSKLSTWIAQIAYNTCVSHLQKKKLNFPGTIESEFSDERSDGTHQPSASVHNDAESVIHQKQRTAILNTAIDNLPPLYKTLITLFHNEQLSYGEIGEITGLSAGTLKSYLFRARAALKNGLLVNYKKEEL